MIENILDLNSRNLWQFELLNEFIQTLLAHTATYPESVDCLVFNWISDVQNPLNLAGLAHAIEGNRRRVQKGRPDRSLDARWRLPAEVNNPYA